GGRRRAVRRAVRLERRAARLRLILAVQAPDRNLPETPPQRVAAGRFEAAQRLFLLGHLAACLGDGRLADDDRRTKLPGQPLQALRAVHRVADAGELQLGHAADVADYAGPIVDTY